MGFVVEERRRNTVYTGGKFYDEILYGLTRDEFIKLFVTPGRSREWRLK